MKLQSLLIATLVAVSAHTTAQTPLTLADCIDMAKRNNVSVSRYRLAISQNEVALNSARSAHLPTVDASASQTLNFGRGLNASNAYVSQNTQNTSFGISASLPLFTGFKIPRETAVARLNLAAATADLDKAIEDLGISVAQAYLQVLYQAELMAVSESQLRLSTEQMERFARMHESGRLAEYDVVQARTLVATDRSTHVQNTNAHRLALLDLSQLLELPTPDSLAIATPEESTTPTIEGSPQSIYAEALTGKAAVKAADLRIKSADKSIESARSGYLPSLYLTAGLTTGYYNINGTTNDAFGRQLTNNLSKSVGLTLSIPIFDRFTTRNAIRQAKLALEDYRLQAETVRKILYKEIQQAYYNAVASRAKYEASQSAETDAEAAYHLALKKYEYGRATITEYSEARTKWERTRIETIQAKYDHLFRTKILDFYRGRELR